MLGKDSSPKLKISPIQKKNAVASGHEFINVFEEESKRLGPFDYLAQGTLYPDVIESADTNVDPPNWGKGSSEN